MKSIFVFTIVLTIALTNDMSASPKPTSKRDQDSITARFDSLVSQKEMGCTVANNTTTFRLFAPRATAVRIAIYSSYNEAFGEEYAMVRDDDGVWEYSTPGELYGKFYGYRVSGPKGPGEMFNEKILIADPYSKAVVTKNTYRHPAKTLILDTQFDWGKDTFVVPADHSRLMIYEAHIRDLTAHPSSGVTTNRGTYLGLTQKDATGGLSYLKDLGVNAVEFLPIQEFANIELPFRDSSTLSDNGEFNTWNPYERNHWGYMTSYYFAPESYYATDGTIAKDKYNGTDGRAVKEFKQLVKTLHKEGIAVIMDVVYNHVSQYDYNPFKYIDKYYYFHTDPQGNFVRTSGCGNDFYTGRPMTRRLIVESILYWMKEYHIDGFRFDIAPMIDRETCVKIAEEAKKINPNVLLVAEPWGGGKYDPAGFSDIGWAAWNDHIRNGVKGQNPNDGLGFIFGKMQGDNTKKTVMSFITGTLREDSGLFVRKDHSVNYLESHDDYTMGDFIRLATGRVREGDPVGDEYANAKLTPEELAYHKLAAMFLFSSQGPLMLAEGQEFGRSKVIAQTTVPDPNVNHLDHNSYEKDNETNYLNYLHRTLNQNLVDYYKGLIELRKRYPAFSSAPKKAVEFMKTEDDYFIAFRINGTLVPGDAGKTGLIVLLNGNPDKEGKITLPKGKWLVMGDKNRISPGKPIRTESGTVTVPPTSGMILREESSSN
ncbi:MAG TPA: alpha-amylase family glycosyl hydrolase [Bacteroidota bacterium]|nr:alpha-amylase family glycosyl hydrolase [Bacteroidota bacterium]